MTSSYALRSPVYLTNASFGLSFLRDEPTDQRKRALDFHIRSGDYFGTLATVLGLVADSLLHGDKTTSQHSAATLIALRNELEYLQETHIIELKR